MSIGKENILEVENLSVEFDGNFVLRDLNFSVRRGEVLAVVGPNGAGKTVLFRSLLNLVSYSGRVDWESGIRIGYVPQKLSIERSFPLTVKEFLYMRSRQIDDAKIEDEVLKALNAVGILTGQAEEHHLENHIYNRRLGFLSGGEFQRILIAWSLIGNPDVILFDEPTAGIDIGGEDTIYHLLRRLQTSSTLSILLISHDLNIVYKYTDTVLCLNKTIVGLGRPNSILDSKSLASLYGDQTKYYYHEHQH